MNHPSDTIARHKYRAEKKRQYGSHWGERYAVPELDETKLKGPELWWVWGEEAAQEIRSSTRNAWFYIPNRESFRQNPENENQMREQIWAEQRGYGLNGKF
jgi:hypothetical protein